MTTNTPLTARRGYPWLVIALSAAFLIYEYILQVSPSLMVPDLMRVFHIQGVGVGNLAATFFYSYLIMQLFAGPLLDKFSPRLLTAIAILLVAFGGVGFSAASTLLEADIARAVIGVGAAFATVSYMKMASMWFSHKQFALVSGLLASAAMVGALFGQAPMALLINLTGWQGAVFNVGMFGVLLALAFYLIVQDRKHAHVTHELVDSEVHAKGIRTVLFSWRNWCLLCYNGLAFTPLMIFGGLWGNSFLQMAYDIPKTTAASLTSFAFIGMAFGAPIFGLISDRLNKRLSVIFLGTSLSLLTICLSVYCVMPIGILCVVLFLFGFGTGAFMIVFVLGRENNPLRYAATVAAMVNTGGAILGAVSEPLSGFLLDTFAQGRSVAGVPYYSLSVYKDALSLLPIYLVLALISIAVFAWHKKKL